MRFTTRDKDNDVYEDANCAVLYKGGWWYSDCRAANPNGLYQGGGYAQKESHVHHFEDKIIL